MQDNNEPTSSEDDCPSTATTAQSANTDYNYIMAMGNSEIIGIIVSSATHQNDQPAVALKSIKVKYLTLKLFTVTDTNYHITTSQ